jgi:hypothetical protein
MAAAAPADKLSGRRVLEAELSAEGRAVLRVACPSAYFSQADRRQGHVWGVYMLGKRSGSVC